MRRLYVLGCLVTFARCTPTVGFYPSAAYTRPPLSASLTGSSHIAPVGSTDLTPLQRSSSESYYYLRGSVREDGQSARGSGAPSMQVSLRTGRGRLRPVTTLRWWDG